MNIFLFFVKNIHGPAHKSVPGPDPSSRAPLHGTFPVRLLSPALYLLCMLRPTRDVCIGVCSVTNSSEAAKVPPEL